MASCINVVQERDEARIGEESSQVGPIALCRPGLLHFAICGIHPVPNKTHVYMDGQTLVLYPGFRALVLKRLDRYVQADKIINVRLVYNDRLVTYQIITNGAR